MFICILVGMNNLVAISILVASEVDHILVGLVGLDILVKLDINLLGIVQLVDIVVVVIHVVQLLPYHLDLEYTWSPIYIVIISMRLQYSSSLFIFPFKSKPFSYTIINT